MTLSRLLVRRLPASRGLADVADALAAALLDVSRDVPAGVTLLLGGSFARGEPCIVPGHGTRGVLSDLDFLLVHESPVSPVSEQAFLDRARALPRPTVYTLRTSQYQRLGTSLGRDFTDGVICLSEAAPPPHDPVVISARDAAEVFVYAVFDLVVTGLPRRLAAGDDDHECRYLVNRVALNALRSAALLDGAYAYHDGALAAPALRDRVDAEVRLRDSGLASCPPAWPRLLDALSAALDRHTTDGYLRDHPDAVTGSPYAHRPGGQYAAFVQRLALALLHGLLTAGPTTPEGAVHALRASWHAAVADHETVVRAPAEPEAFFVSRRPCFLEQLLQMKVATG